MMRLVFICLLLLSLPGVAVGRAAPLRQAPPLPINYGQSVEGELNDIQQAVQYIFDGQMGDELSILMQTTSGDLNAALALATFEGDSLATDDDSGGGTDALISFTLEQSGSYVITATRSRVGQGGAGAFRLTLSSGQLITATEASPQEVGLRMQPIQRGGRVQGVLTPESTFSLYWFEGRTDENIIITPDAGTSLQPLLVLYDAGFFEILRSAPGIPLSATLPRNTLYFVAVAMPGGNTLGGNYAFTLNSGSAELPREAAPGQNTIRYGESLRGSINDTTSAFTFQFSGTAGDTVEVRMARAGGDLDSYLYLLDAGGITLMEDDNSGGASNGDALISAKLPASGDYIILATRRGQASGTTAGNFLLSLRSDSDAPIDTTSAPAGGVPANLAGFPQIQIGEQLSGTLSNQLYFNPYIFQAVAGDELVIRMESTGELDPVLLLLNEAQEPVAENDDIIAEENRDSEIIFTAEQSGYYVIIATRFEQDLGTTQGGYTLRLARVGQEAELPAGSSLLRRLGAEPIIAGSTPSGAFSPLKFATAYSFSSASAGSLVDISVSSDNTIATTIIMTDDTLQPIATTDGGTLLGVELPQAGNYVFFVAPAGGPAIEVNENYILAFNATGDGLPVLPGESSEEGENAVLPPQPLTYGETAEGEINDQRERQDYIFTGVEGDLIRISMTATAGTNLDTLVLLLDAEGKVVDENDDIVAGENRNSLLQAELPADGQYTIRATRFLPTDGSTPTSGGYTLTLDFVDPATVGVSPTVLPILPGQTVSNSVNAEQYLMFYSFTANTGDRATITVRTLSGDLDAVLYLYTYTSAGEPIELTRNDDSPRGGTFDPLIEDFPLPRSGTYLIAVGRYPERQSSGDFTLSLTLTSPGSAPVEAEATPAE